MPAPSSPPDPSAIPIRCPELGVEGEPLVLGLWLVEEGDAVIARERLVELRIPGVTFDVAAPVAGTLLKIDRIADQQLDEGELLGWLLPE